MKFNLKQKLPWIITFGALAFSGNFISKYSHMNVVNGVSLNTPGKVILRKTQVAPEEGRLYSLISIGGALFSLYKILEDDEENETSKSLANTVPLKSVNKEISNKKPEVTQEVEQDFTEEAFRELEKKEVNNPFTFDNLPVTKLEEPPVTKPDKSSRSLFELIYKSTKKHCFIPAETGSGKTTLLLGLMLYFLEASQGYAKFYGSTAKPTAWGGLEDMIAEDGKPHVIELEMTQPETILALKARLKWLVAVMEQRQKIRRECEKNDRPYNPTPIVIIIDEWLGTLKVASEFDRIQNDSKEKGEPRSNVFADLISLVEHFVIIGREDNISIWLFAQDHQVQNCELNKGYQRSFNMIIPTREGATNSIEEALSGRYPIVSKKVGDVLFAEVKSKLAANPEKSYVYCNLTGHEILEVPYLEGIKRQTIFPVQK